MDPYLEFAYCDADPEVQELEPVLYDETKKDIDWAICMCEIPNDYALPVKIKHETGLRAYSFKCTKCGLTGSIYSRGLKDKEE